MSPQQSSPQQSSPQQSSPQQASTSQAPSAPASALAPQGNQAALDSLGLSATPNTDTSLAGPFAALLLDGMPLGVGLPVAVDHIANPAVATWIAQQDPAAIDSTLRGDADAFFALLDRLWPRGVGLSLEGQLAAQVLGGLGGQGAWTLLRDDAGRLCLRGGPTFLLKQGLGLGLGMTDAFGEGPAAAAGLKAEQYLQVNLEAAVSADPSQWMAALGLGPAGLVDAATRGPEAPPVVDGAATHPLFDFDPELALGARASGAVAGQLDAPDLVPDWLQLPLLDLQRYFALDSDQSARLSALAGLGFLLVGVDLGRVGLQFQGQLAALAEAAGLLNLQVSGAPWLELEAAARQGAESRVTLRLELDARALAAGGVAPLLSTRLELSRSGQDGAGERSDVLVFDSVGAALSALCPSASPATGPGPSLASVLQDGAPSALSRDGAMDLDLAGLAEALPDWLDGLIPDELMQNEGSVGFIAHQSSLTLTGRQRLDAADLDAIAATGLRLPGAISAVAALAGLAEAVAALRLGAPAPAWIAPWESAILAHFGQRPALDEARLLGRLALGAGGALKLGAGVAVQGSASGVVAVEVDRPASEEDQRLLHPLMRR